ncbi:MAG: hypothetical protein ACC619_10630, partial [Paracoccaceae bacterium]
KMSSRRGWAPILALTASSALARTSHDLPAHTASLVEKPEFGSLFIADGVEATFYTCSVCHSEMIVAQQGLTRDGWLELMEWMVDEQGMFEIEEPDLSEILDYLAANYNIDRPNFPRPLN